VKSFSELTQHQQDIIINISVSLASMVIGLVIGLIIDRYKNKLRFKQELKDNNSIDITGDDWFAAWHTSVESVVNLNTEKLSIVQKGNTVKIKNLEKAPENPKGGYLWEAQLQFFYGKTLMGWYFPLKIENITSKGIMFLTYKSTKKVFWGKWVTIVSFLDKFNFCTASVKKSCIHFITTKDEIIPIDTYYLLYQNS
jgi:hypothetical protein